MKISPDMREMIDRAVAAGRVTVVPTSVTAAQVAPMVEPRKRGRPKGPKETPEAKRARRAAGAVAKVADKRRFKTTPVPTGEASVEAPADATGTIFASRVTAPIQGKAVLIGGENNSKIGGLVTKGHLRGAPIYTLTLEERATCPKSCDLWRTCYGNAMPHPLRLRHGAELERRIEAEVAALIAKHGRILVRLHILGDFYSTGYVALWAGLLARHPGLHVFGFTAWAPDAPIGRAVAAVRDLDPRRFSIRHSGRGGAWGSFTIDFPTARKRIGDAIVCPEQSAAMEGQEGRYCGSCALCWAADAPIVFVEH
jgi:hypothetical protein